MSDLISSGKVIQKPEIVVDPAFALPGGIVGARHKRADEVRNPNDGYVQGDAWSGAGGAGTGVPVEPVVDDEGGGPGGGGGPGQGPTFTPLVPPTNFRVVSQEPKFAPDGSMTYDVTIEFDDVPNVTGYDIRLSKAGDAEGIVIPVTAGGA